MTAPVLMVVGTASSVGKSVLVTALCRSFSRTGLRVAPFKAQNMSNNAAVTPDGLEIGRAQAEQAAAAGVEIEVAMNPVLLKPQGDRTSQVVLNGKTDGVLRSADFIARKRDLWPHVEVALDDLRARYDLVIAEGAGSAAEPNLYASDIVNMRVARYARAVTLLAGDIDRGGVFAHFLGTLDLIPPDDRAFIRGLIINRFRGDPALLAPAIEIVEQRGGVPVVGTVPWIERIDVAEEDAVALERAPDHPQARARDVDVATIRFPRIANFDDLDPLIAEPGVRVRWVEEAGAIGTPDLIVLPGTKATVADLEWMRACGLDRAVQSRVDAGAHVLGICGGYQMLGASIADLDGVEAAPGTVVAGLGLLPGTTVFERAKETRRVAGVAVASRGPWDAARGIDVRGYEIHMGRTDAGASSLLEVEGAPHGAVSADGRVAGAYLHGLFHNDEWRRAVLGALGREEAPAFDAGLAREAAFDRLADVVEGHMDMERIRGWLGLNA